MKIRVLARITNDGGSLYPRFFIRRADNETSWQLEDCLEPYSDEIAAQVVRKLKLQSQQSITAHIVVKLSAWQDSCTGEYDGSVELLSSVVFKKPKLPSRKQRKLLNIFFKNRGQ